MIARKRIKGPGLTPHQLLAAIQSAGTNPVSTDDLIEKLAITRTPLNKHMAVLIERGLVSRHIDCNPAKRKLPRAIMLTPEGKRTKSMQAQHTLTSLQERYWYWLRKNKFGSINRAIASISDPDIPVHIARRGLYTWVHYLVAKGIIVAQNNGASAKTALADRVFCLVRDEWPDTPPWVIDWEVK